MLVVLLLQLAPGPLPLAAAPAPAIREDLQYQISLGPWADVGRVHLVLKELEPGRYRAEVSGAAQGAWRLTSRWLPERYRAEMVYRDGRLVPLLYREEFISGGKRVMKEYRFDHEHGRLSLWRQTEGSETVKTWEVPMKSPVYDPLTLFYNIRLGVIGPLRGGTTLRVMVLPTPEPREMVFTIGAVNNKGREVMLDYRRSESKAVDNILSFSARSRCPPWPGPG